MSDNKPVTHGDLRELIDTLKPQKTWWQKVGVSGIIGLASVAIIVGALYFKTNDAAAEDHKVLEAADAKTLDTVQTLANTLIVIQQNQQALTKSVKTVTSDLDKLHPRTRR